MQHCSLRALHSIVRALPPLNLALDCAAEFGIQPPKRVQPLQITEGGNGPPEDWLDPTVAVAVAVADS